ncbi:MAG: hypothetical protein QNJ82_19055 [Gammaproteobacteria bacterium]|nr:hypothetical protein [Gammaproteobacteria bacterium]
MISPAAEDFTLESPLVPKYSLGNKVWYLPTNQLNLMFMLASALVSGPAGFGRKYYADALAVSPGWIPLFRDALPHSALTQAVAEGKHLRRVIVALDISSLRGTVQALGQDGTPRSIQFPQGLSGDELALLIPAPLPATWIRSIHFPSKDERAAIEEEATDFANVPLTAYKRQVTARLFSKQSLCPWPPDRATPPSRDMPIHGCAGVGGAMALTFALGNRGKETIEAARALFDPGCETLGDNQDREQSPEALLAALRSWACLGNPAAHPDIQGRLLLSILHALADANTLRDSESSSSAPDLYQTVLDTMTAERERLAERMSQSASERLRVLAADLKGALGLGAHTISELLTRHPRPFSRGLLLFFLRDRPEGLLELDSPGLNAIDYAVAAALFAARSGWMGLPPEVRGQPGLREAVAHRMAGLAHRQAGSDLDLGPAPERVAPLRELLAGVAGKRNKTQQNAALALARGMGWSALLRTRISLCQGDYQLKVDGRGAHLLLDGDVKAVATQIDWDGLLERLSEISIPAKLDAKVRATLGRRRR